MASNNFKSLKDKFLALFSNDIGIDLGTANTLVYVKGRGIVINEPSIVAVNQKTGQVVAIGTKAKEMLGRTPTHIKAVKPLVDGVISDFEMTEQMLSYLLNKAQARNPKLLGPRVVIGVPSGITSVEVRAVRDAAKEAGAREVHIVEEPLAAAIGIGLPVHEAKGSMIIDMGGGTTDIGVISLGGLVSSRKVRIAGDKLDADIISYIRNEFKILIGEKTAEDLKISVGSITVENTPLQAAVRGRDLITGLPREITVTDADIRNAIAHSMEELVEAVKSILETTPPEVLSDVMTRGVYLAGGGAMIRGLADLFAEALGVPVKVAPDPLTAVARGTGIILEDMNAYQETLLTSDHELVPTQ